MAPSPITPAGDEGASEQRRRAPQRRDLAEQPVAERIQRGRGNAAADLVRAPEVHTSTQCGRGGIVMPEEGIERARGADSAKFLADC